MSSSSATLPAMLPHPRTMSPRPGRCVAALDLLQVSPPAAADPALRQRAKELGLRLRADPRLAGYAACIGTASCPSAPEKAEGYTLVIATDGIAVQGYDQRGLVWGLTTLSQILAQDRRPACLVITDWPEYRIRYHHDDVSRKQVSTAADFRRIVRHLGSFKVSHYTVYLEDMLRIDAIPGMGEGRGAFTPQDLRALSDEGERWQVEVFPTLSLSGHQENLLKLPRYRHLAAPTWQPPSSFEPTNPEVRRHLLKILDAVCPLFSSPWFHMGFDEILGMDADGFVEHINWCTKELVKRGKKPLFWADMLYNHFGCDLLRRIHPAATPVAWDYCVAGGVARASVKDLLRHRDQAWILAGYNSWCSFSHTGLTELNQQWDAWRAVAKPQRITGFGASQWGDNGYENHRDFPWAPIASCAEQGWTGAKRQPASLEARFQTVFHGHALPDLSRLRELLTGDRLSISGQQAWRLHRLPAPGWLRLVAAGKLPAPARLKADLKTLTQAERLLQCARTLVRTEKPHLEHYAVAIHRIRSVVLRALAARGKAPISSVITGLTVARRAFRSIWLANNRRENIDVALEVFDRQLDGWKSLRKPAPRPGKGWLALDLGRAWNTRELAISGLPIGPAQIGEVPYRFAPLKRTHAVLAPGTTLSLRFPETPVRDLHLVIAQPRDGEEPQPTARLSLTHKGRTVFEEDLLAIRHLVDWWAPLGEHMWAGGGLAHADPLRVRWILSPGVNYGLCNVSRFPWPVAPVADGLRLTCLAGKPLQVFALTLELAAT